MTRYRKELLSLHNMLAFTGTHLQVIGFNLRNLTF